MGPKALAIEDKPRIAGVLSAKRHYVPVNRYSELGLHARGHCRNIPSPAQKEFQV